MMNVPPDIDVKAQIQTTPVVAEPERDRKSVV